jgi:O-antigen ligase
MPRLVRLAAFSSFLLHGVFILSARYRMSYDAYVHMFFADHYRNDWWSLWDERWYTGFTVTSYPPLVHQLIAALSHVIGLDAAFGLVLWVTVTLLPLAVYYFARIFLGKASAGYAALGAAFLPSAYLTAHIFGQLPFLFGTVLALFGAASLACFLREGGLHHFALTISIAAMTMAAHHAVLLIQPFLVFAVVTKIWFSHRDTKSLSIIFGSPSPSTRLPLRLTIFLICAALFSLIVIFPFWEWGRIQTMQTPIDHASRHNFFLNPIAPVLFFLPVYGPLMLLIPVALFMARKRGLSGLGVSFFLLFLLGLGGTTPLPRLLFGSGWEWLTYDRFAFWSSLLLLPFLGMVVIPLRRSRSKGSGTKIFATLALSSIIVGLVTTVLPLQPGAVDMDRIVAFLERDGHSDWRYITFGFGDQLALLSTRTTATTLDGSYHTARTLPELRTSGIAQIDTAFWFPNGLSALDPVLQKAGERGVRWGFVNIPQYIPVLERNGWKKLTTFESGLQVWENPAASLPEISSPPPANPFKSVAWGTFPILSLVTTLSLASLRFYPEQAEKILRGNYSFLIGLVPISLCFWFYTTIGQFPHPRVYFTYDHALLFLSDAQVILAVILWLIVRMTRPTVTHSISDRSPGKHSALLLPLLGLFLLSSLSTLWSSDWRTSLYISIHLGLVLLFILSLRDWIEAWRPLMLGLCAALAIQVITGFAGFAMQSTSFLDPLDMKWPGVLDPSIRGASVVQLQNGLRVLRAYGTLPHPNILGGFILLCLLGPASLFIAARKTNIPSLILFVLGLTLILLTFSRSSWIGLVVFHIFLLLKLKFLDRSRYLLLFAASFITVVFTLYPIREMVFTRISVAPVPTEQLSAFGRSWLNQQAVEMIMENPLNGVGAGSFILELAERAVEGAIIEPVHSLFLLVGAENGMFGLLLLIALFIVVASRMISLQRPQAILASATLAGLGVISLFDHYLWSLAPGRIMLGVALGLWAGQVLHDES